MIMDDRDGELLRAVGRIEGKIDGFLQRQNAADARSDDQESRIRQLENGQSRLVTVVGLICSGLTLAANKIIEMF